MKKLYSLVLLFAICINTQAQFTMIDDINPSLNQNGGPFSFTAIPATGNLLFFAYHPSYGVELWKTDGNPDSARLVKDIIPGATGVTATSISAAYDRAYFIVDDHVNGQELWVTDGTDAGTHIVTDYLAGSTSSYPVILGTDSIYAIVYANDGADKGVYKTDGTDAGTIKFGGESIFYPPYFMYKHGGYYYYGSGKIYRADGTAKSQVVHKTFQELNIYAPGDVMLVGDTVYYGINTSTTNAQIVKAYGDFTGGQVMDQWTQNGQNYGPPFNFYRNNEHVYFILPCQYYVVGSYEIHHINTTAGTTMTLDTVNETSNNPHFKWLISYKGKTYYRGITKNTYKRQLYTTDGTRAGTGLLTTALEEGVAATLVIYRDTLYFVETTGQKLWQTDGTTSGTKDITPTDNKVFLPTYDGDDYFHNFNDTTLIYGGYFKQGVSGLNVAEIWKFMDGGNTTTGISENNMRSTFSVCPNPATDWLTITGSETIDYIELYDLTGVLRQQVNANKMQVSQLSQGMYFIKVHAKGKEAVYKFLKE